MQPLKSIGFAALAAGLAIILVACGGSTAPAATIDPISPSDAAAVPATVPSSAPEVATLPRPAALAGLPTVELLAPAELGVGRAPDFAWSAFDGATSYRLSVLGPDGPAWAWHGADTSVRYGGVPAGTSGPSLRPGSWWSVSAFDAAGSILALSELRAVSPDDDAGPAPSWATPAAAQDDPDDAAPVAPSAPPATAYDSGKPCTLLTTDEITAAIQGDWTESSQSEFHSGFGACDWKSANGSLLSVTTEPAANYNPDGWGADGTLDGLGSKAYAVIHGWDRRIGFVHGDVAVMVTIDYTRVDMVGLEALASLVDERLP